jgi:hypothetical protein
MNNSGEFTRWCLSLSCSYGLLMRGLILVFILLCTFCFVRAEGTPNDMELLFVPWALHLKQPPPSGSAKTGGTYPLVPNRASECLPGLLYDVREHFTASGARFRDHDFALFCPEANLLVVRAADDDRRFVREVVGATAFCPPSNLQLTGEVIVQPTGAEPTKAEAANRLRFVAHTQSGMPTTLSASGSTAIGYTCEIQLVLDPGARFVDYQMVIKVLHGGREYSATSTSAIPLAKPHSMLLGTTPTGDEVRFVFTPTLHRTEPLSPLDDPERKKWLLECIGKALLANEEALHDP